MVMTGYNMCGPHCPGCGSMFTVAHGYNTDDAPTPGSVHICLHCLSLLVMENSPFGLMMRKPTADERAAFMADPEIVAALQIAKQRQE